MKAAYKGTALTVWCCESRFVFDVDEPGFAFITSC